MQETIWLSIFWLAVALLFLAYPGYPLILALVSRKRGEPPLASVLPSIGIVLVARNEAGRIEARLRNLLDSACSVQELIVVSDGSTDQTVERAKSVDHTAIRVIELEMPKGKPAGVCAGIAAASAEVIVLCDARQRFDDQTIGCLARWFADPTTGAVSGALEIEEASSGSGKGVDAYWRLEKAIRRMESDLDSCVGCTGAVYAVRRALFPALPDDLILDDVVVPMKIAEQGMRIRFDPEARAFDPQQLDGERELRRKIRTLAGNFQMMAYYPTWIMPSGHRLWWMLIPHKYLRLLGPVLLGAIFVSSAMLAHRGFFAAALTLQAVFVLLATIGRLTKGKGGKVFSLPAGFLFLQWCVVKGFVSWLLDGPRKGWR